MNASTAMSRSYTTNEFGADVQPKAFWPKTLAEAKRLIAETFAKQGPDGWSDRDIKVYFEMKGVGATDVSQLTVEEARIILGCIAKSRMIIFREDPES